MELSNACRLEVPGAALWPATLMNWGRSILTGIPNNQDFQRSLKTHIPGIKLPM